MHRGSAWSLERCWAAYHTRQVRADLLVTDELMIAIESDDTGAV